MKVCVFQPSYSLQTDELDKKQADFFKMIDKFNEKVDLIVLPEYSFALANADKKDEFYGAFSKYNSAVLSKAQEMAKRCSALVFVNAGYKKGDKFRNTTFAINRKGEIIGKYFKAHPAPSEVKTGEQGGHELDVDYSYEFKEPYILQIEGIRFAFLTCYDFYFYENFAQIAKRDVDIIIGCSLQRTDTHESLSIINRFLCYQTNAYLIRSSVSLGENSETCGCSMVVSPKGEEIINLKNKVGYGVCEIVPEDKYYKAAGFGGDKKAHYEYIEEGRRPWLYRNGGASVVPFEDVMKYPRICAHRGFNTIAPENTMPAFGAAVALGAEEIEFDVWSTKDGVLVSCHDDTLDRVSDGNGKIYEKTYDELEKLDFGIKFGEKFRGLKICKFEEILQKFASRVIMNIHVKIWDANQADDKMEEIISLIKKYDCEKHVYFMTCNDEKIKKIHELHPEMRVCVGWDGNPDPMSIADRAIALNDYKVQLFKPYFNEQTVKKAHEHGIICNVFYADDPEEAKRYRDMGIDCILTNDYLTIRNALTFENEN